MNTINKMLNMFVIMTVLLLCSINFSNAYADQYVVIGERGQILVTNGTTYKSIRADFIGKTITDTYYNRELRKVFFCSDSGRLYEVIFSSNEIICNKIVTGSELVDETFWDYVKQSPAWLSLNENNYRLTNIKTVDSNGVVTVSDNANIAFVSGFVYGTHIEKQKKATDLINQFPALGAILSGMLSSEWIVIGRSKNISLYGKIVVNDFIVGQKVTATYLLHDKKSDLWTIKQLNEDGNDFIYDDIAVIQGVIDIKGARCPDTNNLIPDNPSGKWYFWIPEKNQFITYTLRPSVMVHYADMNKAYISENNVIYTLDIKEAANNEMTKILELPEKFSVKAIYPLN